jgi:putative transposase
VRRECLDWLLIANQRHLGHVLRTFIDHYNGHRPHRALGLVAPDRANVVPLKGPPKIGDVGRRDRLDGLIHEYRGAGREPRRGYLVDAWLRSVPGGGTTVNAFGS